MARNKSEKRSPDEQARLDYIKAWVEFSCTEDGARKAGNRNGDFAHSPGRSIWYGMSQAGRSLCGGIDHNERWEWLRAQK